MSGNGVDGSEMSAKAHELDMDLMRFLISGSGASGEQLLRIWKDAELRESICWFFVESVEKVGTFEFIPDRLTGLMAEHLSCEDLISFYEFLKGNAKRLEGEWRESFEKSFPGCMQYLPPIEELPDFQSELFYRIQENDIDGVDETLNALIGLDMDLDFHNSDGETPRAFAQRLGHKFIATLLAKAGCP